MSCSSKEENNSRIRDFVIAFTLLFHGFGYRMSYQTTTPSAARMRTMLRATFLAISPSRIEENTVKRITKSNHWSGNSRVSAFPSMKVKPGYLCVPKI